MHEYPLVLALCLLTLGYGLVSRLSERVPITAPMVFVAAGLLVGPAGLGLVEGRLDDGVIRLLAEITLTSILFVEASTIDLRRLIRERGISVRLLLVGLPITMVAGTLLAAPLFPAMSWTLLALMAFVLSPTDAALGQVVVTSERVPAQHQ